jgi:hypothetical protein
MWIRFPYYLSQKVHGKVDGRLLASTDHENENQTRGLAHPVVDSLLHTQSLLVSWILPAGSSARLLAVAFTRSIPRLT